MDFCFRGDNYKTKKEREISIERDMPTGTPLHSHQVLSNCLKYYQNTSQILSKYV